MKSCSLAYFQTKFLFGLLFLSLIGLFSCSLLDSGNLKEFNLKGSVKSVTTLKYKAVEKFGKIEKKTTIYREDNDLTDQNSNTIIDFDESGKLTKLKYMDSNGSTVGIIKVESDSSATMYSGDGDKLMVIKFTGNEGPLKGDFYLANGDLFMRSISDMSEDDLPIEVKQYNGEGKLVGFEKNKYNKQGLIEEIEQMEVVPSRRSYYDSDVQRITNYRFTYNESMDPVNIEYTKYNRTEYRECTYEYDKKGNWIRQYILVDSKPKFILERDIVYYK